MTIVLKQIPDEIITRKPDSPDKRRFFSMPSGWSFSFS